MISASRLQAKIGDRTESRSEFNSWHARGLRRRVLVTAVAVSMGLASALAASGAPSTPADLDPTFGTGGVVTTDFGASETGEAIALSSDGRIVVVGGMNPDTDDFDADEFVVARYTAEGALDPTFDEDGKVMTDIGGPRDEARAVTVQPDGKIVAGGWAFAEGRLTFALVRYNADGSLDPGFGGDGKVSTVFGASYGPIADLALQPDGKIVAVGGQCGATCEFALARYQPDGTLDPAFSEDGKTVADLGGSSGSALSLQPDGKIVAAGRRCAGGGACSELALLRYDANGNLDPTFDGDGRVSTDLGGTYEWASDVAVHSDGHIVASGSKDLAFAIVRYNPNGSFDPGFGGDGVVTDAVGSNAEALAIRPDGKIVLAGGHWGGPSKGDFALMRLNPDGSVDTTFSADGRVVMDFNQTHDYVTGVALQSDGRIFAAGVSGVLTDPAAPMAGDFALARFLADGAPPPPPPPPPPARPPPPPLRPPAEPQLRCVVPNVKGKTVAQARRLLQARRCALGRVVRAYSRNVRKGRVISQRPTAARRLPRGTRVHVKVSRGRRPS